MDLYSFGEICSKISVESDFFSFRLVTNFAAETTTIKTDL